MQEFGRDAIWFDYVAEAAAATPEFLAKFDAVLLDAPTEPNKVLAEGFQQLGVSPMPPMGLFLRL